MKKCISLFLALAMICALATPAFATDVIPDNVPEVPTDFGDPIDEITYYDENRDAWITERTFFAPDSPEDAIVALNDDGGSGWFQKEYQFRWSGSGKITTAFARGYFRWGNGDVSVSNPSGGHDYFPSNLTITGQNVKTGTGRYGLIFNKYAYVTYTLGFINFINNYDAIEVTIRISQSGNNI